MIKPISTALQHVCKLQTPSSLLNQAFLYAKDSIARCMRYYYLGSGMSNAPHYWSIVVGRDTAWMSVGADYVAPRNGQPHFRPNWPCNWERVSVRNLLVGNKSVDLTLERGACPCVQAH